MHKENQANKRISIDLIGNSLDSDLIEDGLINKKGAVRYRDAYCIRMTRGVSWLFDYGVLVSWDISEDDRQQLTSELKHIVEQALTQEVIEQYAYRVDPEKPFSVHRDILSLPNEDELTTLALSHAFAQSAKLGFFEEKARKVIQQNSHISRELAEKGKVSLSKRGLARLRGILFDTSSDITLHYNLLDIPEFFWDYPECEADYLKLAKYLDLIPRVEILNKKLETIHDLLDMLAAEQYHKHTAFLEWIIIILIAIEIVLYVVH